MSEGTPIDAIERGDVADAADAHHMQAILADVNASGADIANGGPDMHMSQGEQPRMTMRPMHPPMYNPNPHMQPQQQQQQQQQQRHYVDAPAVRSKSASILDRISDPIIVAVLIFVLSLPVLHTYGARYASWAFAIGGQLSWLGLIALSLIGGLLFGISKASRDILGL
jgi:hypothetical protein